MQKASASHARHQAADAENSNTFRSMEATILNVCASTRSESTTLKRENAPNVKNAKALHRSGPAPAV